jgi:ATP-binding cassette subfamily B protein
MQFERVPGEEERIAQALRLAGLWDVVEGLPAGINTVVGAGFGGATDLSGGQWQRLALARGLMRRGRDLMILDEPSSGLDAEAEAAVHDRLRELRAGSTSVLVSHRLSAVRRADRIVVVQDGRILESGDHASLIVSPDGVYAKLFGRQAEGYREDPAPEPAGGTPVPGESGATAPGETGAAPRTVAAG